MTPKEIINWLQIGDPVIVHLVNRNLLEDKNSFHQNKGYIEKYLNLYDTKTNTWGGGIYSPLWISSNYTLLELKYMEITFNHPIYQKASLKLLEGLWFNKGKVSPRRFQDMCMSAMLLNILCYGRVEDPKINQIIDYILGHQMSDGGWNCAWDSTSNKSSKGSFHTTISVLEALSEYKKSGYVYKSEEVEEKIRFGEEYLLDRKLMYSLSKNIIADINFLDIHYPPRYRYDSFRALEYFVDKDYPYDPRMEEVLILVKDLLSQGPLPIGKQYSGKRHFRLENTKKGRFNTYRALKIIKKYDPELFKRYIISY